MLNVVLVGPEIPANTGNIGRTCVVAGARLHLIEPIGFSRDHRMLHRAGLGYWENLDVTEYASWDDFLAQCGLTPDGNDPRVHLLTKKAKRTYAESAYRDGDYLVFGSESSGIPEDILALAPERCERIPMLTDRASLSNRDAWRARDQALHPDGDEETSPLLRQDICGNFIDVRDYRISALNLSNAAAVVLYEALRQTGFPGME